MEKGDVKSKLKVKKDKLKQMIKIKFKVKMPMIGEKSEKAEKKD